MLLRFATLFVSLLGFIPAIGAQTADLTVQTDVSQTEAFVNEQIVLRRRVDASGAAFNITGTAADISGADVLKVIQQSAMREARQQQVAQWAIFARDSGQLNIGPHQFQATLPATGGSNPVVRAASNPLVINILPAPNGPRNSVWLPAAGITIDQQWSRATAPRIGEPKKLIITVTASGQRAAAIPPLQIPGVNGLRLYPSPATLTDKYSADGVTGVRVEQYTVVAAATGQALLPSLSLDWFDTTQREWKQAHSNSLSFTVKATSSSSSQTTGETSNAWWMALILPLTLLALGTMTWLQSRPVSEGAYWRRLKQSLRTGRPDQIRQAILKWAQARWPSKGLTRFEQVAAMPDDPTHRQMLRALDAAAYGVPSADEARIDATRLRAILRVLRNRGLNSEPEPQSLARLYQT